MKSFSINSSVSLAKALRQIFLMGFLCVLFACAKPEPEPEPEIVPPAPQFLDHTVRFQGETLGLISKWYTGESSNWKQIVEANPGLRPERINMGDVISIPLAIVTREEEMPRKVLGRRRNTAGASAKEKEAKAVMTEEVTEEVSAPSQSLETAAPTDELEAVAPVVEEKVIKEVPEQAAKASGSAEDKSSEELRELEEALEDALGDDAVSKPAAPTVNSDADSERQKLLDELLSE